MSILFINACVRENSRTLVLAKSIVKDAEENIVVVDLGAEDIRPLDRELLDKRDRLIAEGNLSDPMLRYARQFAEADEIFIAAPFWDLSFPSLLKIYLENITVSGITFRYCDGRPTGLCRAKRLTYVTTAGGPVFEDFGYSYVKALAKNFYGVESTVCYRATGLDVNMISAEDVLTSAEISVIE